MTQIKNIALYPRDASTVAIETIDYPHHEVHTGTLFLADVNTEDLDSDPLRISFTTLDNSVWCHLVILASAAGAATMEMIEAPTGGVSGGVGLTVWNRNRNSATTSQVISTDDSTTGRVTDGASAPTGGITLHHEVFGTGKNKVGGESRDLNEWILLRNTKYCFSMTSTEDSVRAQLTLNWYEHIPINV